MAHIVNPCARCLRRRASLWDTASRCGFDYLSSYKKHLSYGAEGFYPGTPLDMPVGASVVKGDLPNPAWFNEFVTVGGGIYGDPRGVGFAAPGLDFRGTARTNNWLAFPPDRLRRPVC
jgi:hypothetical protein